MKIRWLILHSQSQSATGELHHLQWLCDRCTGPTMTALQCMHGICGTCLCACTHFSSASVLLFFNRWSISCRAESKSFSLANSAAKCARSLGLAFSSDSARRHCCRSSSLLRRCSASDSRRDCQMGALPPRDCSISARCWSCDEVSLNGGSWRLKCAAPLLNAAARSTVSTVSARGAAAAAGAGCAALVLTSDNTRSAHRPGDLAAVLPSTGAGAAQGAEGGLHGHRRILFSG